MRRLLRVILLAAPALAGCGPGAAARQSGQGNFAEDGDWTILLCTLRDPIRHVQLAATYKKRLSEELGWRGVYVIDKAGHSEVYWGRYSSPDRAQRNLKIVKAHATQTGVRPFDGAIIMPVPGKPFGPPEWDLTRASGEYTLLVAVFQDDPEHSYVGRQKFAVDYCTRLRKGGYDGYYYHGPSASHVTIGTFGPQDVRIRTGPRGEELEILNPRIAQLQRDFPMLAINGTGVNDLAWEPETRKMVRIPKKTYLIRIPRGEAADGR